MMMTRHSNSSAAALCCLCLCLLAVAAAAAAKVPRGVAPGDAERYAAATFDCGGGRSVPAACVNDGYCDCCDGGTGTGASNDDEPGTGACASGRFFCRNRGHRGESVAASRVNDGVCDCCDGSDEWARPDARCADTCRALGAATRAAERRALDAAAAGLSARAAAADAARTTLARMRSELGARRAALAAAEAEVQRLDEIRARVQERETRRAEQNQQQQQKKKEEAEAAEKQQTEMVAEPTMQEAKAAVGWEVPTAADGVDNNEQQKPTTEAEEEDGGKAAEDSELEAPKEDVAVADTVEEPAKEEEVSDDGEEDEDEDPSRTSRAWDAVRTFVVGDRWLGKPALWRRTAYPFVWAWHRVRELISDDTFKHEDEEFWCPSPPATVFNPKTRKAQSEVDAARHKAEDIKAEVQKLEKLLDTDFGADSCFYSLHGTCVEIKKDEYTYELCPFDKATQKGGSHTSLGTWDRWGDDHKAMHFEHGVKCWNGPERNVRVDLECGVENKLLDASEPARCEYVFKMSTPCACTQEAADALAAIIKQHEVDDREDD